MRIINRQRSDPRSDLYFEGSVIALKIDGMIVFFGCDDLDSIHEFYTKVLGLSLFKDQGSCRIYNSSSGSYIGFCNHLRDTSNNLSPIITILTEDVDSFFEMIRSHGIESERPSVNRRFGIYHFFLRDPEGNRVEIQRFLD